MTDRDVPEEAKKEEESTDDNDIIELKEEIVEVPPDDEDIIDLTDISDQPLLADEAEDAVSKIGESTEDEIAIVLEDEISDELDLDPAPQDDIADALGIELDSEEEISDDLPKAEDVTDEQVEAALERVIKSMFYEKIDRILVEVIEKTVTKEIERLKGILLEDKSDKE